MQSSTVTGADGVKLHVDEAGNRSGRPIVFIHGFSQCRLAWNKQMNSDLARDFRLVAFDLRGHGLSDSPPEGYIDSKTWADDINAILTGLKLDDAVLVGWSYGPLVILDYIRHYGEDRIGGSNMIAAVTKLGSDEAMAVLSPEFINLIPGFFSESADEGKLSLGALLEMCFANRPSDDELKTMLEYNVSVPYYVRQGMFSRSFTNDDLLPNLKKPVLVTHGVNDRVVKPIAAEQHSSMIPAGQLHLVEKAGHAPFWDDADGYNARLKAFCDAV
ncbi:MAG: alpha/beta fold hydrolase [Pyrinomonadaceae bacterium]